MFACEDRHRQIDTGKGESEDPTLRLIVWWGFAGLGKLAVRGALGSNTQYFVKKVANYFLVENKLLFLRRKHKARRKSTVFFRLPVNFIKRCQYNTLIPIL